MPDTAEIIRSSRTGTGVNAPGADPRLWVATAGKGGAGKSVLTGTLARVLARRGHRVLAIDSDPMPGLSHSLGMPEPDGCALMGAADKPEGGRWRLKPGVGPARVVSRYTTLGPDGIHLLQMGKAHDDGLRPLAGAVNAFLEVMLRIGDAKSLHKWAIIGDLPAGPRHPGAGFSAYARLYVVVVEPTSQSALTGRRILRLARDHLGADVLKVASKVSDPEGRRRVERLLGEPVDLEIPLDPAVVMAERHGEAVFDAAPHSAVVRAVEHLADEVQARTVGT